jgi:hypothetical protein
MMSRKHPRYRVEYGASFSGERLRAPGVILDLSSNGCRARSANESSIGEALRVLIDVPRYDTPLHVTRAVVRWARGQEFGMEFIEMGPDDQERLQGLVGEMAGDTALRM